MGISSAGIGSSLDVNSIVTQLMQIERQPVVRLDQKEASYQAQLSAYGTLKSAMSSFQSSMASLAEASKYLAITATPSDATVLTASASASAGTGTHAIEITQLAQAQKLVAGGQASVSTAIGTGTISIDFGTITGGSFNSGTGKYTGATWTSNGGAVTSVTIDSSNNTLSGIRDAINAASAGLTATIVNDGGATPYRLVLTSTATGKTASAKISVTGDAALQSLLAHDSAGTQNLSETLTAQNAALKVDGLSVSKASNSITDVVPGVTLTLAKTNAGAPLTLTVARDSAAVQQSVQNFVTAYNSLAKTVGELTAYDAATRRGGLLQGDQTARGILTAARSTLNTALVGAGGYTGLSQLGVAFQKDGTLALDTAKLQSALSSVSTNIGAVFAATGKASDGLISYTGSTSATTAGSYALSISQIATRGNLAGSAAAALTINVGANDTIALSIDGVSASVTLSAGTYASADALAAELQSKINSAGALVAAVSSVTVAASAGVLTITSARYGSSSAVNVTGGNGATDLLGASPSATAGLNVSGTIGGGAATGSGQILTAATGSAAEGLGVTVSGGSTGARGTIDFSKGYAYRLNALANTYLGSSGMISSRTDGINGSIRDIGSRRDAMNLRLAVIEKRYRAQFTALDRAISSMNQTSTYLSQQLAQWNKSSG